MEFQSEDMMKYTLRAQLERVKNAIDGIETTVILDAMCEEYRAQLKRDSRYLSDEDRHITVLVLNLLFDVARRIETLEFPGYFKAKAEEQRQIEDLKINACMAL